MSTHPTLRFTHRLRECFAPSLRHVILAESCGNTPFTTPGEPLGTFKYLPFPIAVSDCSSSDDTVLACRNPAPQGTLQARRRSWEIQPGISRREIEELREFHPGLVPEAVETLINGPTMMQTYPRNTDATIHTLTATFIFDKEETKTALIDGREVQTLAAFRSLVAQLMIAGTREYGILGIGVGVVEGEDAWAWVRFGGLGVVVVEKVLWVENKQEERREWGEAMVNLEWTGRAWPQATCEEAQIN